MLVDLLHPAPFTRRAAAAGRVMLSGILAAASLPGFFHAQDAHAQDAASQLELISMMPASSLSLLFIAQAAEFVAFVCKHCCKTTRRVFTRVT